jgi:TRAP transporter TAXI family solute receptor
VLYSWGVRQFVSGSSVVLSFIFSLATATFIRVFLNGSVLCRGVSWAIERAAICHFYLFRHLCLSRKLLLALFSLSFFPLLLTYSPSLLLAADAQKSEIDDGFIARHGFTDPRGEAPLTGQRLAQGGVAGNSDYGRQVASRNSLTVSIISGDVASTYLRMAADLANVLDVSGKENLRVIPVVGKGGVQNVLDVLFLRGIDMGIIQQGQLSYLSLTNPKIFKDIKKRIQYVTKLYNAEFHILARRNIASMRDLVGHKISLGKRLGSTDMVGRTILSKLDIDADMVNMDLAAGLASLQSGQVDAVAVLGGAPVEGLGSLKNFQDFHFLPITPQTVGLNAYFNLVDEFLPTKITHDHYPQLIEPGKSIASIASGVILVVYNWKSDTKRYKKLAIFVDHFFSKFEELRQPARHPKWHEVSLNAKIPGLFRFEAANEWLAKRQQQIGREVSAGEMKIAMDVFVRQYSKVAGGAEVTPLQRDDIWASLNRTLGRYWINGVPRL